MARSATTVSTGIPASSHFSFEGASSRQTEVPLIRLFVGIPMPADIRMRVSSMASGLPGARWTREESYHLTLRYIGEVDQGTADDIDAVLGHISVEPFDIALSGIGYFGKAKSARAVWAGSRAKRHLDSSAAQDRDRLAAHGAPGGGTQIHAARHLGAAAWHARASARGVRRRSRGLRRGTVPSQRLHAVLEFSILLGRHLHAGGPV